MTDFTVANKDALTKALANAKSGDRILLAPGNYGVVSLKNKAYTSDVTITSLDPNNLARIDNLKVNTVSHVAIRSVEIGRPLAVGEATFGKYVDMSNVSDITIDKVFVHGSTDGNFTNDGNGIGISNGKNITITNSRFDSLGRGLQIATATNVLVQGNSFQNMRSDGADFANIQGITIDSNTFKNFFPDADDHPDAIQFWTTGTTRASTNIVISNNQILQGEGRQSQGIFLRDQIGTLPYENVKIINNIGYMQGYNGITVGGGKNVEVSGNTFVSSTADKLNFWIRLARVDGGVLKNNVADMFVNESNTNLTVYGNKFLDTDKTFAAKIAGLNLLGNATVASLTVAGVGYQSSGSSPTVTTGTGSIKPIDFASTGVLTEAVPVASVSTVSFATDAFLPASLASTPVTTASTPVVAAAAPVSVASTPVVSVAATSFTVAPAVKTSEAISVVPTAFTLPSVLASASVVSTSKGSLGITQFTLSSRFADIML